MKGILVYTYCTLAFGACESPRRLAVGKLEVKGRARKGWPVVFAVAGRELGLADQDT